MASTKEESKDKDKDPLLAEVKYTITDTRDKPKDLDGTRLNLFSGECNMPGYNADIMIRKGGIEIKQETYNLLRNFQHNSAIPLLDFFVDPEARNLGRFAVPKVRCSFEAWVKMRGKELFTENGGLATLFKNMISDMCDLIEKLHKLDIRIVNFNLKSLYIANETAPRILILLAEVESCSNINEKRENFASVRGIIEWCHKECDIKLNHGAEQYVCFIGSKKFTLNSPKNYPDDWDYVTKKEYLMSLIAADQRSIRDKMKTTEIKWPLIDGKLPRLLQEIVDNEFQKKRVFRETDPFDYIMLVRNSYKHFDDLPRDIKTKCVDKEGFLKMMECWTPNIWTDLYNKIGWL